MDAYIKRNSPKRGFDIVSPCIPMLFTNQYYVPGERSFSEFNTGYERLRKAVLCDVSETGKMGN